MTLDPSGYWFDTERHMAVENYKDRRAAALVNADWLLTNAEPFGSLPEAVR